MARRLRHEDPRQGREHFDLIVGVEWECGPDPNDISGSKPDAPWSEYYRTLEAPRTLSSIGEWRVTSFGLELVSTVRQRYERYEIPATQLLDLHRDGRVYKWPILIANEPWGDLGIFEQAFKAAIHSHCRLLPPVDFNLLDKTFERARGIAKARSRDRKLKRHLPPRLPKVRGAVIVAVEQIMNGHADVWLRCQSPKGYPAVLVPRPADGNDVRVLTAAYPTFFSPSFDGPQTVYCAARWQRNDWFLLMCEQPRAT